MTKKYDAVVYIGRFQPVHDVHIEIINRAAVMAHKVIVIVGSAFQPRTYKNPFSYVERKLMLSDGIASRVSNTAVITIDPNMDSVYNDQAWTMSIQETVSNHTDPGDKIAIIGHKKDDSSFYLDMFPQWEFEPVELIEPLNATNIRDLYFRKDANMRFIEGVVPARVAIRMESFMKTEEWEQIIREREFVSKYKQQFSSLPYPPIFVTSDAVVFQSGHVLMIKRRAEPGKGLWALPGGFVNAATDRSVKDAMLRELREETGIKVPAPVLAGSIVGNRVFDAIERSARGRTITHAFNIVLPDGLLPRVKGADDAEKARWVPFSEVRSDECFEDHYELIQHFLGA